MTSESASWIGTMGYSGWSPAQLREFVLELRAQLWDIRMRPWSKTPAWRLEELSALIGQQYRHVPALGNRNYTSGDIVLANPDRAIAPALSAIANGERIILLCGCRDHTACHRAVAADFLVKRTMAGPPVHYYPPARQSIEQAQLSFL